MLWALDSVVYFICFLGYFSGALGPGLLIIYLVCYLGYFSGALGPGQLGMFNLLKSYSILDPEVGYCQVSKINAA